LLTATEGWAVGTGTSALATMLRWDGTLWALVPSGTAINDDLCNHIDAAIADSGFPTESILWQHVILHYCSAIL
jgi:hypothetical protein